MPEIGQQSGGYFAMPVLIENGRRENDCKLFFKSVSIRGGWAYENRCRGDQDYIWPFVLVFGWLCYKHVPMLREGFGPE